MAASNLETAISALARGDAAAALRAASEACHDQPDRSEAHYAYGQAWLAVGEPARAEPAFATAIRLRPGWADAWINYGLARYRQGAIEDAKAAMRQALSHAPGHPAALSNLGAMMRISGEGLGAEALLREALVVDAGNAGARLNLVADLLLEERGAEALALLDEASPPSADLSEGRHWRLQRALALIQLGRTEEAKPALAELEPVPPELRPLWRWRRCLIAAAEGDGPRARQEASLMEQDLAAMGPNATPEHQVMSRFDLAKFWSTDRDHARAFGAWVAGHALLRESQPFSRPAHRAFVDASIAHLDRARFSGPRAANRDHAPVFVVGMPRSGTTLVEQILGAHRDVHAAGERPDLGDACGALGWGEIEEQPARIAGMDGPALDAAAATFLADLHRIAPDAIRIVDKMPSNYLHLGLVGLMLPGARIIHCLRDPRDIGLSIFTFRFHGAHPYAHDLADLGWTIGEQLRLMDHWKAALPNPILTIRLSDWVEDFDATLQRVLSHLDLPPDPACARFYESDSRVRTVSRAQVRQPVNARGLGRWRAYAAELAPLIGELDAVGALDGWNS